MRPRDYLTLDLLLFVAAMLYAFYWIVSSIWRG